MLKPWRRVVFKLLWVVADFVWLPLFLRFVPESRMQYMVPLEFWMLAILMAVAGAIVGPFLLLVAKGALWGFWDLIRMAPHEIGSFLTEG